MEVVDDLVDEQPVDDVGGEVGQPWRAGAADRRLGARPERLEADHRDTVAPSASAGATGLLRRVPPST